MKEAILINQAYEDADRSVYQGLLRCPDSDAGGGRCDGVWRRRSCRKKASSPEKVDATVSFCTDDGQLWHNGRVRDLSILGIRLQSHEPVEIGQHIIIASSNSSASAVHGTVVWKDVSPLTLRKEFTKPA